MLTSMAATPQCKADFDCLGDPPRLIQRAYELIGPTTYGWWQETNVIYAWHGPKLVLISRRTFKRRGAVTISNLGIGHGCTSGVVSNIATREPSRNLSNSGTQETLLIQAMRGRARMDHPGSSAGRVVNGSTSRDGWPASR